MRKTLEAVRTTHTLHEKDAASADEAAQMIGHIDFLDRVLEFSATWNGVPTNHFFPDLPQVRIYLAENRMLRLGEFFAKPYAQVSRELRKIDVEYPSLLKEMYQAYYLCRLNQNPQ